MRSLFLLIIILHTTSSTGQTYQIAMERCTNAYQRGFDTMDPAVISSKLAAQTEQLVACVRGLKFPSFTAATIDGKMVSSKDLTGKVVLINLWYISCPPCVAEIPVLNDLQSEFNKDNVLILAFGRNESKYIEPFLKKHPMNFHVFPNSEQLINETFKMIFGYPTNIILDKEGRISDLKIGGSIDEVGLTRTHTVFKELLQRELTK